MREVWLGAERASQMYYRLLVVIVSKDQSKDGRYVAEGLGVRRVNLGEKLGEELLEVPAKRRPLKVARLLEDLLDEVGEDRVLLDHVEILFEESLKVEPLALLKSASRRRLIVVIWRGEIEAGNLCTGSPDIPSTRVIQRGTWLWCGFPGRSVAVEGLRGGRRA